MDPISQGVLGALVPLALFGRSKRLPAKVIASLGALAGMAPDLDVLIRSAEDPLLAIEFHRHFTHSLAFAPVGALLALLPWLYRKDIRQQLRLAYIVSLLGYLTHAPLDCLTTYGTQLFWPFSDERVALSWVSVVDPLFTLPALAAVYFSATRKSARIAQYGLALGLAYFALGGIQQARVLNLQQGLITSRGQETPSRQKVFTTFMNQVTWRSVYETNGVAYVDQIRVPYVGTSCVKEGGSVPLMKSAPAGAGPEIKRGFKLMNWFSNGWVNKSSLYGGFIGDLRYAFVPYGLQSFWGVGFNIKSDTVTWINTGAERNLSFQTLIDLIFNNPKGSVCIDG